MIFPRSFVQIHYHNRPGGVTTVMAGYADAFAEMARPGRSANLVICDKAGSASCGKARVVHVPACEYARVDSKKKLCESRDTLIAQLDKIISRKSLPRPVAVVGHNLSLGKNIALSSAFSSLARRYAHVNDVRFYSVVHDFAEEGRSDLLREIRRVQSFGCPVWQDLYLQGTNVQYVVVNRRNLRLLRESGFAARLLLNPVRAARPSRLSLAKRQRLERGLTEISTFQGTGFDPSKKTYLYPVRIVSRKNAIEAVIACCILRDGNLLLGESGTSEGDRRFFKILADTCRRHRLAVVFDVGRVGPFLNSKARAIPATWGGGVSGRLKISTFSKAIEESPRLGAGFFKGMSGGSAAALPLLYRYADWAVSFSVAEGFGYALYEPWVHGCGVIGRRPAGFCPAKGQSTGHLYERFDVPVEWVPVKELTRKYWAALGLGLARPSPGFERSLRRALFAEGAVDFGSLSHDMQLDIFNKLLDRKNGATRALGEATANLSLQESRCDRATARGKQILKRNRSAVVAALGKSAFRRNFKACFSSAAPQHAKAADAGPISRFFRRPEHFRLLLTPWQRLSKTPQKALAARN